MENVTSGTWTVEWLKVSCGARGACGSFCPCKGISSGSGPTALIMALRVTWAWAPHWAPHSQPQILPAYQEAVAKQYELDPARCLKLQEKNKHMDPVPVKVWRKVTRGGNIAKPELYSFRVNRNKSQNPHMLTSLVINREIRHLSGDKNVKVILSALDMGSFWSWKALKGSSSFSPAYFCLSEHKLLQPLPRLLVSETKPFPFRALQALSNISFSLTCLMWTVSPEHAVLPTLPLPDVVNN